MTSERFDVVVVGAGPAGSVAALVLARGGARVALVDKSTFARDKACGDLVGPRGVQVLEDLGLLADLEGDGERFPSLGDMLVVGPTGRRVRLPSAPGLTYPGRALAVPRMHLDATLRDHALEAGAEPVTARAEKPMRDDGHLSGFELADGRRLEADVVIGADGATSAVADAAALVDAPRTLWGFAVRCYLSGRVELPAIVMWEPEPRRALCGYGWVFPGPDGANVGLGVGTLSDRRAGSEAVRLLPRFLEHLVQIGLAESDDVRAARGRLGGWLKMGMVGTTPATRGVLLAGDAAGLVNPIQGEGISHAMTSAVSAAEAVLAGPSEAHTRHLHALASAHLPYQRVAATAHRALLSRPRAVSAACRMLTLPVLSDRIAEGWAVFWNELLDGAPPGRARTWAAAATAVGKLVTGSGATSRWFEGTFDGSGAGSAGPLPRAPGAEPLQGGRLTSRAG